MNIASLFFACCFITTFCSTLLYGQEWEFENLSMIPLNGGVIHLPGTDSVLFPGGLSYSIVDLKSGNYVIKDKQPCIAAVMLSDTLCAMIYDYIYFLNPYTVEVIATMPNDLDTTNGKDYSLYARSNHELVIVQGNKKDNQATYITIYDFSTQKKTSLPLTGSYMPFFDVRGQAYSIYNQVKSTLEWRDIISNSLIAQHSIEPVQSYRSYKILSDSVAVIERDSSLEFLHIYSDSIRYRYSCPYLRSRLNSGITYDIRISRDEGMVLVTSPCSTATISTRRWKEIGSAEGRKVEMGYDPGTQFPHLLMLSDESSFWLSRHFAYNFFSDIPSEALDQHYISAFSIINTHTMELIGRYPQKAHSGITAASYSLQGKKVALQLENGFDIRLNISTSLVDIYDAQSGELLRHTIKTGFPSHQSVVLSFTGDSLFSIADSTLYCHSTTTGTLLFSRPITAVSGYSIVRGNSLALSPDGQYLVYLNSRFIRVFSTKDGSTQLIILNPYTGTLSGYISVHLPVFRKEIMVVSQDARLFRFDLLSGMLISTIHLGDVSGFYYYNPDSWSATGHRYANGTWVFDTDSGNLLFSWKDTLKPNQFVSNAFLSTDGNNICVQHNNLGYDYKGAWYSLATGNKICDEDAFVIATEPQGRQYICSVTNNLSIEGKNILQTIYSKNLCPEIVLSAQEYHDITLLQENIHCISTQNSNQLLLHSTEGNRIDNLYISSVQGEQCYSAHPQTEEVAIDISSYPQGIYYWCVVSGTRTYAGSFMVLR